MHDLDAHGSIGRYFMRQRTAKTAAGIAVIRYGRECVVAQRRQVSFTQRSPFQNVLWIVVDAKFFGKTELFHLEHRSLKS